MTGATGRSGFPSAKALLPAFLLTLMLIPGPCLARADDLRDPLSISPTVFMAEEEGRLFQAVLIGPVPGLSGEYSVLARTDNAARDTMVQLGPEAGPAHIMVPACESAACKLDISVKEASGGEVARETIELARARRWKIFVSPFSHIDIGFTNSQRKILAQNIENLRAALELIDVTGDYPQDSRFRFFTEVSWPLYEFLHSDVTSAPEKERMLEAIRGGQVEVGAFLISHQDRFMPAEALFRSTDPALAIGREAGVEIRTGCLNDLMDLSGVVKPLHAAGVPYFIGGPNTSRYAVPPLFFLQPPEGNEKVLAWITPNLNGYGENFDFAMRPELPLTDESLAEIESRLGDYLKSLEERGAPPAAVRDHFDFYGARWDYPFDVYLLPFYPPHAVDNGPQDVTASELAKAWNHRWAWPRLVVATPSQFFAEALARYGDRVPTLRGELPGFWGEQVFFSFAQVDPAKESGQRAFERSVILYEASQALSLIRDLPLADLSAEITESFKLLTLNNDHNPGPVPFGHTSYTKEDVAEWKRTRREWIETIDGIGRDAGGRALAVFEREGLEAAPLQTPASALDQGGSIVLENEFYRVELDKKTGGVSSLIDKELGRELASADGRFLLNQYVAVARGENAGVRGNLFARPGFRKVKAEVVSGGPDRAIVRLSGPGARHPDQLKVVTALIEDAFGVKVPAIIFRAVVRLLKVRMGPVDEVTQGVELRAGEKKVYFTQSLDVDRDQAIDHAFAYPLNVPEAEPLVVEGPYCPYRFAPGPPLGTGDLVPAARMTDVDFPGINDFTWQFGWIYGMPADAVFKSYVLAWGGGFGIAFSSMDSGVVFPGPIDKDPVTGPFGGGFYHLALGWTAYGRAFLGAPREGEYIFRSALTSFPARDLGEAKTMAARFGREFAGLGLLSEVVNSSNPAVIPVMVRPLEDRVLLVRLYESSGRGGRTTVSLAGPAHISSARRGRSDGLPLERGGLMVVDGSLVIDLAPAEVATLLIEFGRSTD